jgi:hypothetical protein
MAILSFKPSSTFSLAQNHLSRFQDRWATVLKAAASGSVVKGETPWCVPLCFALKCAPNDPFCAEKVGFCRGFSAC